MPKRQPSVLPPEDSMPAELKIDPAAQQLYGIRLAKVERDTGQGAIKSLWPGRSRSDSRFIASIFGTDGYVKETHDDAVGNHVMKDQHLAVVYSPEFLAVFKAVSLCKRAYPGRQRCDEG